MKIEETKEMSIELQVVADKYGVKNWAFCGDENSKCFVGLMQPKNTQGGCMLTILNIGRLWQYARQSCRELLNNYEVMSQYHDNN